MNEKNWISNNVRNDKSVRMKVLPSLEETDIIDTKIVPEISQFSKNSLYAGSAKEIHIGKRVIDLKTSDMLTERAIEQPVAKLNQSLMPSYNQFSSARNLPSNRIELQNGIHHQSAFLINTGSNIQTRASNNFGVRQSLNHFQNDRLTNIERKVIENKSTVNETLSKQIENVPKYELNRLSQTLGSRPNFLQTLNSKYEPVIKNSIPKSKHLLEEKFNETQKKESEAILKERISGSPLVPMINQSKPIPHQNTNYVPENQEVDEEEQIVSENQNQTITIRRSFFTAQDGKIVPANKGNPNFQVNQISQPAKQFSQTQNFSTYSNNVSSTVPQASDMKLNTTKNISTYSNNMSNIVPQANDMKLNDRLVRAKVEHMSKDVEEHLKHHSENDDVSPLELISKMPIEDVTFKMAKPVFDFEKSNSRIADTANFEKQQEITFAQNEAQKKFSSNVRSTNLREHSYSLNTDEFQSPKVSLPSSTNIKVVPYVPQTEIAGVIQPSPTYTNQTFIKDAQNDFNKEWEIPEAPIQPEVRFEPNIDNAFQKKSENTIAYIDESVVIKKHEDISEFRPDGKRVTIANDVEPQPQNHTFEVIQNKESLQSISDREQISKESQPKLTIVPENKKKYSLTFQNLQTAEGRPSETKRFATASNENTVNIYQQIGNVYKPNNITVTPPNGNLSIPGAIQRESITFKKDFNREIERNTFISKEQPKIQFTSANDIKINSDPIIPSNFNRNIQSKESISNTQNQATQINQTIHQNLQNVEPRQVELVPKVYDFQNKGIQETFTHPFKPFLPSFEKIESHNAFSNQLEGQYDNNKLFVPVTSASGIALNSEQKFLAQQTTQEQENENPIETLAYFNDGFGEKRKVPKESNSDIDQNIITEQKKPTTLAKFLQNQKFQSLQEIPIENPFTEIKPLVKPAEQDRIQSATPTPVNNRAFFKQEEAPNAPFQASGNQNVLIVSNQKEKVRYSEINTKTFSSVRDIENRKSEKNTSLRRSRDSNRPERSSLRNPDGASGRLRRKSVTFEEEKEHVTVERYLQPVNETKVISKPPVSFKSDVQTRQYQDPKTLGGASGNVLAGGIVSRPGQLLSMKTFGSGMNMEDYQRRSLVYTSKSSTDGPKIVYK